MKAGIIELSLVLRSGGLCNGGEAGVTEGRLVLQRGGWCYRVDTDPEAVEVGVGVVVGLVVCLHQRGDDLALLLAQPGSLRLPLRLPLRLLILPPLDQIFLPLHLLICQNDWEIDRDRERGLERE